MAKALVKAKAKAKAFGGKPPKAKAAGGKPMYSWKPGSRFGVKAAAAGRALEAIRRGAGGGLTPAAVVEAAAHPDHPLHRAFTWDDTEAAARWREHQARHLLYSLRVTVDVGRGAQLVYVSVNTREEGRTYLPTATVMTDAEYRDRSLAEALRTLEGFERRWRHLDELVGVFAEARRVRSRRKR